MLPWIALLLVSGCSNGLPETIPVSGIITFEGTPPPKAGNITFLPLEMAAGQAMRPAWAQFDADGRYEARAFSRAEGIVPGKYEVRIDCWKRLPNEATGSPGESYVPEDWIGELVIPADSGDPIIADFDVVE